MAKPSEIICTYKCGHKRTWPAAGMTISEADAAIVDAKRHLCPKCQLWAKPLDMQEYVKMALGIR